MSLRNWCLSVRPPSAALLAAVIVPNASVMSFSHLCLGFHQLLFPATISCIIVVSKPLWRVTWHIISVFDVLQNYTASSLVDEVHLTNRHHNTSSVTDMLHTLDWTSLEHCRATSRLCMLFQIYHGSIGIPHDPYILPYRHTPRPSRQTDMHTLATYQCRTNYFKCSFFPQTIVAWNALTKSVVTSSTLDAFKAALPLGRPIPC